MSDKSQGALVALSEWIDAGNTHRDPEAITWGRLAKIAEEGGEVIEAFIGATGQNPRKGVTCAMDAVLEELLDVAVTALGAYEHIDAHRGRALGELDSKILRVAARAGIASEHRKPDVVDRMADKECHEGVTRDDLFEPCDRAAVAYRLDPEEGTPYPVCHKHHRPPYWLTAREAPSD